MQDFPCKSPPIQDLLKIVVSPVRFRASPARPLRLAYGSAPRAGVRPQGVSFQPAQRGQFSTGLDNSEVAANGPGSERTGFASELAESGAKSKTKSKTPSFSGPAGGRRGPRRNGSGTRALGVRCRGLCYGPLVARLQECPRAPAGTVRHRTGEEPDKPEAPRADARAQPTLGPNSQAVPRAPRSLRPLTGQGCFPRCLPGAHLTHGPPEPASDYYPAS